MTLWGAVSVTQAVQARRANTKPDARLDPSDWMSILIFVALLASSVVLSIDNFIDKTVRAEHHEVFLWVTVISMILKIICELCAFSLLVCVFAISVHGVRITSSSAMLGRLQYTMLSVNLVQSVVVIVSWVLVVIVLRHDAQTQAELRKIASWVVSVPVISMAVAVFIYGGLLVRRINQSRGSAGQTKLNSIEQAKQAAATKVLIITGTIGALFMARAIVLILHSLPKPQMKINTNVLDAVEHFASFFMYGIILFCHGDKLGWRRKAIDYPLREMTSASWGISAWVKKVFLRKDRSSALMQKLEAAARKEREKAAMAASLGSPASRGSPGLLLGQC